MSKTFKRRAGYALLYWFTSTLLATMIYSQMRWVYFIRVGKTAAIGEKLQFYVNVEKTLVEVRVPPIILQPLVENAIKHGVAKQTGGGWVRIDIKADKGNLKCQVIDNCGKLSPPDKNLNTNPNQGLELRNIRERLKCIFNDDFSFNIENNTPAGVIATMVFPISPKKG